MKPSLRRVLRGGGADTFFADHIARYTKSRRKAPIYWQLATPSASYSVWLYYHRFTKDTFYKVLNDYVTPKLQHEERKLTSSRAERWEQPAPSQRKEIAEQEAFVEELRTLPGGDRAHRTVVEPRPQRRRHHQLRAAVAACASTPGVAKGVQRLLG